MGQWANGVCRTTNLVVGAQKREELRELLSIFLVNREDMDPCAGSIHPSLLMLLKTLHFIIHSIIYIYILVFVLVLLFHSSLFLYNFC